MFFHNAANDAWFTLELLFLEAEQAVKQLTDPDGVETIDWMAPPAAPPSSPSRGAIPKDVYESSLSTPTCFTSHKLRRLAHSSSLPASQSPHTPLDSTRRRHKNRNREMPEVSAGGDTVNSTAVATPTEGNPPAKKQKLSHGSDVPERVSEGLNESRAIEHNEDRAVEHGSGSRDGLAEAEEQHGEEGKEESEGKPMFVTSGAP